MIKALFFFLLILLNFKSTFSRNSGETEITTEDGIEVFQEEKFYLLKKNVEILSDELELKGQVVKIYFENDLYDIKLPPILPIKHIDDIYEVNNNTHKGNLKLFRKKELMSEKKSISNSMNLIFN